MAISLGGPCGFDPPPGDYSSLRVINDTKTQVYAALCDDARCTRWTHENDDLQAVISAGGSGRITIESCGGGSIGIGSSAHGPLLRCLIAPTLNSDTQLPAVRVSAASACAASH